MSEKKGIDNMKIYDMAREVPEEAKRTIEAGRLRGFTDINPMWRLKRLTEIFGPCGLGWWYTIKSKRLEEGKEGEIRAFVDVELYYKWNGEISQPIPGTGGASFVTQERGGLYVSDECFKMALTDALSVAAKAIGVAADVYYAKDRDKYTVAPQETEQNAPRRSARAPAAQDIPAPQPVASQAAQPPQEASKDFAGICTVCGRAILPYKGKSAQEVIAGGFRLFGRAMCGECIIKANKEAVAKAAAQQNAEAAARAAQQQLG